MQYTQPGACIDWALAPSSDLTRAHQWGCALPVQAPFCILFQLFCILMAGAMTGATRRASILRFESQIEGVIGEYEKVNRLNEVVKGLDAQASAYTDADGAENIVHDDLENIQQKRENIDKEIARATAAIVLALNTQAVVTPGSSSKDERYARQKPMTIPSPLEGKGADLQDMMLAYVLGKGTSMTTLIPAIQRMVQDFSPDSGLWWSWKDLSDKDDDYLSDDYLSVKDHDTFNFS